MYYIKEKCFHFPFDHIALSHLNVMDSTYFKIRVNKTKTKKLRWWSNNLSFTRCQVFVMLLKNER